MVLPNKITMKDNRKGKNNVNMNIQEMETPQQSHFDEAGTLATLSTFSMSSSEDEQIDVQKSLKNKTNSPRRSRKNQKQTKGSNSTGKGKGKGKNKGAPKRVSKATSTKTHDAPMQRRDLYFALDCEMVGVGPEGLDSALARVSIVNWDNEIVLDTYVKVDVPVTDYRTFVSGIKPEQIQSNSAMTLSEVQGLVTSTLQGKILIGHGLKNDLNVMGIRHPWCDIRDTATYAPFMRSQESRSSEEQSTLCPRKLRDLVWERLGKQIQVIGKAHSPVEDAIAAMDLYKAVRNEWETEMVKQVNTANQADEERCRRSPVMRRPFLPKVDIGSRPLFASNQCHQMRYAPSPPPLSTALCDNQSMHYAAMLAQEHAIARSRAAAIAYHHHHEMMLHC
mmetsp:Transcript_5335/g.6527  ORF Transcript_5335/g.6527 Transcript_5335/m.6527 type:complete len:392 (+) Transcript_5335:127-1302(+)